MIVDAHLDIAWNATSDGRGFLAPPAPGYVISRPALTSSGVGLVCATLYTAPARARRAMRTRFVYENAHEAHIMAVAQVNYYKSCGLQLIRDSRELQTYVRGWRKGQIAAVLLMEGADPIETPSQLGAWTDMGVRIIGPAWSRTRYSGGTGATYGAGQSSARTATRVRSFPAIGRSPTPPRRRSRGEGGSSASASIPRICVRKDEPRWTMWSATRCTWRARPAAPSTSVWAPTSTAASIRDTDRFTTLAS